MSVGFYFTDGAAPSVLVLQTMKTFLSHRIHTRTRERDGDLVGMLVPYVTIHPKPPFLCNALSISMYASR